MIKPCKVCRVVDTPPGIHTCPACRAERERKRRATLERVGRELEQQRKRGVRRVKAKPEPKARAEIVKELSTGVMGCILRRVWLLDTKLDTPAALAYVVRFYDGREKRVSKDEIEFLKG